MIKILLKFKELDEIKTYPNEIIPGLLYLGNIYHATDSNIKKDLKFKAYIDCTNEESFM